MFFTKSKKIVSLASAIAIIAACGGTAFASPQAISQTTNDTTFNFNSILLECVMNADAEASDMDFSRLQ